MNEEIDQNHLIEIYDHATGKLRYWGSNWMIMNAREKELCGKCLHAWFETFSQKLPTIVESCAQQQSILPEEVESFTLMIWVTTLGAMNAARRGFGCGPLPHKFHAAVKAIADKRGLKEEHLNELLNKAG